MKKLLILLWMAPSLTIGQIIPFNSEHWKFKNQEVEFVHYLGKEAVLLKKNSGVYDGTTFQNGIIEYDMAFPQERAFIGLQFRIEDDQNYEEFYVRPHQSGNPDANQYTPVYGGNAAWQLYYGAGYGAPVKYNFNQWMHFKLVIKGPFMEVYINDMETPALFARLKRKPARGKIGISNGINQSYFANLTVREDENVMFKTKPESEAVITPATVERWQVSEAFDEKLLEGKIHLSDIIKSPSYERVSAEPTGTLNISSVRDLEENVNTVFAKVVVSAEKENVKKLYFGFSDRVTIFVNGTAVYHGEDNFVSRDYRFLGTIGYFDSIYVPLSKGKNEIVFAVSESFGGWGIKAKFEDSSGIKLEN